MPENLRCQAVYQGHDCSAAANAPFGAQCRRSYFPARGRAQLGPYAAPRYAGGHLRGTAMNTPTIIDPVADAESMPLDEIDVSDPKLYQDYIWQPYFARLRRDDPEHWRENAMYGSFLVNYQVPRHHGC